MIRVLAALASLVMLAEPVWAGCYPYYRSYSYYPVVQQIIKEVRIVKEPVLTYVPLYLSYYTPQAVQPVVPPQAVPAPTPAAAPAKAPCEDTKAMLAKILTSVQTLENRTRALEESQRIRPTDPVQPPPQMPRAESSARQSQSPVHPFGKCASCHTEGRLNKDTQFVLLRADNSVASLSSRQLLAISRHVYKGTMPPKDSGVTMSDEDVGAVMAWIDQYKPREGTDEGNTSTRRAVMRDHDGGARVVRTRTRR